MNIAVLGEKLINRIPRSSNAFNEKLERELLDHLTIPQQNKKYSRNIPVKKTSYLNCEDYRWKEKSRHTASDVSIKKVSIANDYTAQSNDRLMLPLSHFILVSTPAYHSASQNTERAVSRFFQCMKAKSEVTSCVQLLLNPIIVPTRLLCRTIKLPDKSCLLHRFSTSIKSPVVFSHCKQIAETQKIWSQRKSSRTRMRAEEYLPGSQTTLQWRNSLHCLVPAQNRNYMANEVRKPR